MKVSNTSLWLDTLKKQQKYPSLKNNISVDVAIIGGGLTGISTAYELSKSKQSVAVIASLSEQPIFLKMVIVN